MRTTSNARLALAVFLLAIASAAGLAAQAASPLPTRKPIAQITLKSSEYYYLDTFRTDIDRLESGLNAISAQKLKLPSKDRLNIFLDSIDLILFRQYCDREGIKVSDGEVSKQIDQYLANMGQGATMAMLEESFRRNGIYTDVKTYAKRELLFTSYIRAKKANEIKALSQPSTADVLKAYDDMKFNLRRPATYRITMLRAVTQAKSDADKKKIGDTMRDIASKLKQNPGDFDDYLVRGTVESKSAGYQTILPVWIAKTPESRKQYPALYDAAFKLKEGEVSDLVEDETGYSIIRASAYLPEKQLGLDDTIEGLTSTKAASINPGATVLQLVVNEMQNQKLAQLQKSTQDEINTKLRKEATITINIANLADQLEAPEIAAIKALANKGSGYSLTIQ